MLRCRGARVGLVGLVLAACSGTTSPSTTVAPIPTTSSPPSSIADAVVPFETGRQTLFEPNGVYRQDVLLVPIEVSFGQDGWRSDASREQLVTFLNTGGTSVAAAIAIWTDGTTAEDLLASLVAGADEATDPSPRTVGGVNGDVIDVRFDPQETDPDNQRDHPCDNAWDLKADQELGEASQFERKQFGSLAACGWSRLWVGSLAEGLLAVIGISRFDATPGDPGELSDLAPTTRISSTPSSSASAPAATVDLRVRLPAVSGCVSGPSRLSPPPSTTQSGELGEVAEPLARTEGAQR